MRKGTRQDRSARRVEFGDWQTPVELCKEVLGLLKRDCPAPDTIIEPTCGEGAFLLSAAETFPGVPIFGYEINELYLEKTRGLIPGQNVNVKHADFFEVCWEREISNKDGHILVIGNPPWVTISDIGSLGLENMPEKMNFKHLSGIDALTGKSNFDISEWMILRLLSALTKRNFTIALLVKTIVARKILEFSSKNNIYIHGRIYGIDTKKYFEASVDGCLLIISNINYTKFNSSKDWICYKDLYSNIQTQKIGMINGRIASDITSAIETNYLEDTCELEWRSGIKHDCSKIMELTLHQNGLINGFEKNINIENDYIFPLLKGSDIANDRKPGKRFVIVTQKMIGEPTVFIKKNAPNTWKYLNDNINFFINRKSAIYKNQPNFSIFGVGGYSFLPYKIAICGLYKKIFFVFIEPYRGKPVMVDDTCYFLGFNEKNHAHTVCKALNSNEAKNFFESRIFWDSKRPINKNILQSISISKLIDRLGYDMPYIFNKPKQSCLPFGI